MTRRVFLCSELINLLVARLKDDESCAFDPILQLLAEKLDLPVLSLRDEIIESADFLYKQLFQDPRTSKLKFVRFLELSLENRGMAPILPPRVVEKMKKEAKQSARAKKTKLKSEKLSVKNSPEKNSSARSLKKGPSGSKNVDSETESPISKRTRGAVSENRQSKPRIVRECPFCGKHFESKRKFQAHTLKHIEKLDEMSSDDEDIILKPCKCLNSKAILDNLKAIRCLLKSSVAAYFECGSNKLFQSQIHTASILQQMDALVTEAEEEFSQTHGI